MTQTENFDIIIIGGGPAGYVAAIRAAQLGFSVACCDAREQFGGTCLNVGCIPSKALLQSSALYHEIQHAKEHGIIAEATLDFAQMQKRKNAIVERLCKGIAFLFKKNKVTGIQGFASFQDEKTIHVVAQDKTTRSITANKAIIIASGSVPSEIPGIKIDEQNIVSSTGALSFDAVPEHLVIAGGGVIGLEIGSVYRRLGSKVTVVEFLDTLTPGMDKELTKAFQKSLEKMGMTFLFQHKITAAECHKKGVHITVNPAAEGGEPTEIAADKLLVAIGRRPYTDGLGLEKIGIKTEKGALIVDKNFATSIEGIYAIGDCIGGMMLAHKAEEEGIALVESLAGEAGHVDYTSIPSIIYTEPEVAFVGMSEEQLQQQHIAYSVGKASFGANGRAMAMDATDGFAKVLACPKTDRILGAHIIGPAAGDLLHEVTAVMAFGGSSEDLARINHAHPTLAETLKEAAKKISHMSISA